MTGEGGAAGGEGGGVDGAAGEVDGTVDAAGGIGGAAAAIDRVAEAVGERITRVLEADAHRWASVDPELLAPFDALRAVSSGGKRLRPAFCYWSFVGAGGSPEDPAVIDAGAAIELLHTMALVHDDVMDRSRRRHDVDTIHVTFAQRHAAAGWRGDAGRFGEGVAILMGDVAQVYADRLLAGAPPAALATFDEMRLELNAGQYLDLLGSARGAPTVEEARRICRYKTATYTVERPLHLGAALAAPDRLDELVGPLSAYGAPLGEAFQLRDDLLGTFGDPGVTGKPVGEDLREGKPTMLVALAYQGADAAQRAVLDEHIGRADLGAADVARVQSVIEATGGRAELEATIARLVAGALAASGELPLCGRARTALGHMARFVAGRDR